MSRHLVRRTAGGFFVSLFLLTVATSPALAQSSLLDSTVPTRVAFTADEQNPFTTGERALAASVVAPARPDVSFMAQQGSNRGNEGIGFGVLGMITRTTYSADGLSEFFDINNRTGWGAGLWVGGNRNGRVGFVGEFIYLVRGDDDFRTKALQIPAVFHVNIGSRNRDAVAGYLVVGPSFTINLKQEFFGVDVSDDFTGVDIGIIGGAGVEIFRIGIEGRGNWGLRNINRSGDVNESKTFTFELLGKFAFN